MKVRDLIYALDDQEQELFVQVKLAPGYHCAITDIFRADGTAGPHILLVVEPGWEMDFVEEHSRVAYVDVR